ncbi:MAG: 4,5-dihydroxyphthalate decarboxylase, partial [Alphaproteobacteria bacterium]|nr:4,5-dihydroxyphthalate decarboxylase [Alphaproteobacteria bacterium]
MATTDYDHIRDLATGAVRPEGIDLTCLTLDVEEIFHRFIFGQEWDVSELSMGMSTSRLSYGDAPFVLLPVFPSRVFRQSSIYILADGPVKRPADLKGRRIGVPEWGQTAGIYTRGWLEH